jgi:hypothetical protein
VAVLNMEECDEDSGLIEESLRQSVTSSIYASIRTTLHAPTTISEYGAVSANRLLALSEEYFSPEIALFIGLSTSKDKSLRIGDVVVANTFASPEADRLSAMLDAKAVCDAGLWPQRAKRAPARAQAVIEAIDGFPIKTGRSRISAIPGRSLRDFPDGPTAPSTLFIQGICGSSGTTQSRAALSAAAFSIELLAHRMKKTGDLQTLHAQLLNLTPEAFERVIGAGLSGSLGIPFRQAASGRQLSGDVGGGTVRVEAKRYRTGIPSNRDLLGGLDSIARTAPDIS